MNKALIPYMQRWQLQPDGQAFETHSSLLMPVRYQGAAAMLKIAREQEEKFGGLLMCWWQGEGAAQVLAWHQDGILLERAQGRLSLAQMVRDGEDRQATAILCQVVARLHAPRAEPLPELIPLDQWFNSLWPAAQAHGGMLRLSATVAAELLTSPREQTVLHGDIHHDNVLDFAERGWLAIDPKRLYGERAFDYANIFCNPNYGIATDPDIFLCRVDQVCRLAGLERQRLLQWILAWAGLSAAWFMEDGEAADIDFRVAEQAARALGLSLPEGDSGFILPIIERG
ncbi:Aminoglycoside/hydroxyurea antibiotic resistance kinase [Serratia quinivorans]|uniref:aminoglycoside phosphotransferase family protein n=1 Tax=Serratia quinivorans TaxID=137545 RepID=UPI00217ADA41|nr:aminoglycoside phosphotransferase family protein [Serratia quinivorans]CAI0853591.1 Aminoglycoside/hydroxyurea antibiotic resistance kinase [Serratia quinivorans]CAI0882438.1 Aminoglycoside/hydroxyurea antibiotic resistance kinase [Serratia quinivorans]CAI1645403.1 Aminoglycoside/hydroxyurea antibiotic resistance kinase [Serratia quinivorans]CAI2071409.1 Aminoglycoside/hydroxyurea antibiotic resistance kinase [Serratia quinivorans]CAI2436359.1 Aminoglycoside/hydroxyurea antibiotic resistanc